MRTGRNVLLALDTAVVAGTNALILILAARILPLDQLPSLTMAQLLVVTAVGLQRASILTPSFASHRGTGPTVIPVRWSAWISLPGSVVWGAVMPLLIPSASETYLSALGVCVLASLSAMVQDLLRYALFSRNLTFGALGSDTLYLLSFCLLCWVILSTAQLDWESFMLAWACAGATAAVGAGAFLAARAPTWREIPVTRVRDVVPFGRWSGADAALSGAANLLPMAISTLALGSPVAAIYRVLQAANGPFNILSATFITSAGMDAWKLSDQEHVRLLRNRALRQSLLLAALAAGFYSFAYPVMLLVSGLSGDESTRVAIILGVSGVLGAATIPVNAAAVAMGFQRVGFIIRVFIVVVAILISVLVLWGVPIPWGDPVGVVAIVSGLVGLVGWLFGFERGYRREVS